MPERSILSQEEIDSLINTGPDELGQKAGDKNTAAQSAAVDPLIDDLSDAEKDALGEVGNITMGSAATALSEILGRRVDITSPEVKTMTQDELFSSFKVPYVAIDVEFTEGLEGHNLLILKAKDVAIIADIMMGGDGSSLTEELSEIMLSAASEAMNQMIGSSSTSLASMFKRTINMSPPKVQVLDIEEGGATYRLPDTARVAVTSFRLIIEGLLDTTFLQVLSLEAAKQEASQMLHDVAGLGVQEADRVQGSAIEVDGRAFGQNNVITGTGSASLASRGDGFFSDVPQLSDAERHKLSLLMEIPLKVSVVLGRTRRPIKDVLGFTPGAIVELSSLVDEPVEILVNGTIIAQGEIVVVNENFGIRITNILSRAERVRCL